MLLGLKRQPISKHRKGYLEHLVTHCDEDSAVMLSAAFQALVEGFKVLVMKAEIPPRQEHHIAKVVVSLFGYLSVRTLASTGLLDDRIGTSLLDQLTGMGEMGYVTDFSEKLS